MQNYFMSMKTKFASAFYARSFVLQNRPFHLRRNRGNYVVPKHENRKIACSALVVGIRKNERSKETDRERLKSAGVG